MGDPEGPPIGDPKGKTRLELNGLPSAVERIRQAACRDKKMQFTTLWHHVYDLDRLRVAYLGLKREPHRGSTGRHGGSTGKTGRRTSRTSPND